MLRLYRAFIQTRPQGFSLVLEGKSPVHEDGLLFFLVFIIAQVCGISAVIEIRLN